MSTSIVLIGMPGAGKSTLGVLLAKELGLAFIDTDLSIQVREGKTLQQIIDQQDYLALRRIEEEILLSENITDAVVSTGGSAVYSQAGMERLKKQGLVIYLDVPLQQLRNRIDNYESRGIARKPGQSFSELFEERRALYDYYADYRVACDARSAADIQREIIDRFRY